MATSSQQSAFLETEIVKFRGRVCLIVKIDRQFGFNRISVVDVDTGHQMAAFGYELERCEEVAAALLPDFETTAGAGAVGEDGGPGEVDPNDTGRWAKMDDEAIDGLDKNRHSPHTATQTKWAVGVFRGKILTLILEWFGWRAKPVSLYEARFLSSTNILSAQDQKSLVLILEDLFFSNLR